jgi:hypothetical protein
LNAINDAQPKLLIQPWELLIHLQHVLHGLVRCGVHQKYERIAFARPVTLGSQECLYEPQFVWNEVLIFALGRVDGGDSALTNVGVLVFKAGTRLKEEFEEFGVLGYSLKETACCTTNVLVRMFLKDVLSSSCRIATAPHQVITDGMRRPFSIEL